MPLDPFCIRNANLKRVDKDDPDLGPLVGYARSMGARVWRGEDNKVFITHKAWGDVPQTSTLAGDTIQEAAQKTMQALRAFSESRKNRARTTRRIVEAEKTIAAELNQTPPMTVNDLYGIASQYLDGKPAMTDVTRYTTGFRVLHELGGAQALIPLESSLSRMGIAGNKLANLFRHANQLEAILKGQAMVRADKALQKLTHDEIELGFQRYVEHGEAPSAARKAVMEEVRVELTKIMDEFYDAASRLGIPVEAKVGISDLNPTGNYFPHFFDMVALRDKRITRELIDDVVKAVQESQGRTITKEDALQVIAEAGLATNREMAIQRLIRASAKHGKELSHTEATEILNRYVSKNAERRAGNLEADRLNVGGYTTNARLAYVNAISRNSRRMAEWTVFGQRDQNVHALIDQIRKTSGKQAYVAQKAYWLEIGKEGAHLQGVARELYNWQAAKLSLAVFSNMTQSTNTIMRTGLRPFIMAARDAVTMLSQDRHALRRYAEQTGAMPKRMLEGDSTLLMIQDSLHDIQSNGLGRLLSHTDNKALKVAAGVRRNITDVSLAAFEMVESMNRFMAQRAGEYYFKDLVAATRAQPKGNRLTSLMNQAKELGFTWEAFQKAAIDNDTESLRFMSQIAGLRISDYTQFRGGVQAMPLWASEHAALKFVYQFKTFALNQARFFTREVFGPHGDNARRARAVAAMLVAYPALGLALSRVRSTAMGETALSEQIGQWLDEAIADPISASTLALGIAGFVQAGSLGIVSDIVWSASQGNRFNLTNMFIPPAASSIVNMMDGIGAINAMGVGLLTDDDTDDEWNRLRRATAREFGGFGAAINKQYERIREI